MHKSAAGFLVLACALVLQSPAAAAALTVLYDKSRISCVSRQENVPVEARFKEFTAGIEFDPARPETGKIQIDLDVDSFDLGNAEFNDEAKNKDWFDVRNFPRAKFVSAGMRALGRGRFEARGRLTIKGTTNEIVAPFTYQEDAGGGVFDGAFVIKRLQYNIGVGAWKDTDTVADDVQIRFHIAVAPGKPAAKK